MMLLVVTLPAHWLWQHGHSSAQHGHPTVQQSWHKTATVNGSCSDHSSDQDQKPSPAHPHQHHHGGTCVFCQTITGSWQPPAMPLDCLVLGVISQTSQPVSVTFHVSAPRDPIYTRGPPA
ncbi:MAG: hypothetical protein CMJ19_04000 [Phycisphaeraceae bacterium]|nr:hypothetical protein [Phycisphaeraceae bacterium]